jgi:fimbrial chaperone protein
VLSEEGTADRAASLGTPHSALGTRHCLMFRSFLLIALLTPAAAAGSSFTVNPTRVYLGPGAPSALLQLKNESPEPLRMQLKAQAWSQTLDGDMRLSATEDLIVFPALLTLKPGEERKIRVAAATTFGATEKSYRLYIEELPPSSREKADGASVKILTRMGVPVFLQPAKPQAAAVLRELGLSNGRITFQLANTGNTHYVPTSIVVRGFGGSGQPEGEWPLSGWYVLAASARTFAVVVPRPECERVRSLLVEVHIGDTLVKGPLTTPGGVCGS